MSDALAVALIGVGGSIVVALINLYGRSGFRAEVRRRLGGIEAWTTRHQEKHDLDQTIKTAIEEGKNH